jgi:hypothetical protein
VRIEEQPPLPSVGGVEPLRTALNQYLNRIARQINGTSEGSISAHHGASTAAPTTGTWAVGDFVLNATPAEAGAGGSKYVIHGWRCTASGTPGTWLELRCLTGN